MKKLLALLMSVAMLLSVAACGGGSDEGETGGEGTPSAEGDASGTTGEKVSVSVAKEYDVISLSSILATDGVSFEVIHATVDGLMAIAGDGSVVPAIAESYELSEDGLVYTFKLREDANWDNDTPVTAHDFVFAWQSAITNPEAEYAYLFTTGNASLLNADAIHSGDMDKSELGVKAIDDKTLEITLTQKTPYFLSLVAFPVFFPVNEEFYTAQGDQYAMSPENLLANGAYKIVSREVGTKLVLEKNAKYYDADAVKIDELIFNIVPEVASSVTAYVGGDVDYTKISSTLIDGYKDDPGFTEVLGGYLWYLQPNFNTEIGANLNFRMALAYAVNKTDLTENILKDGSVPGHGFTPYALATGPDGVEFRETAGEYNNYDEAMAQEYFAKALEELGTDSITIELLYENADPAKTAAEYLQYNLQSALPGLTIEMNMQPKESRLDLQRKGEFEMVLTRWGPDYADPTTYLNLMMTGNSYNYGNYSGEAYDAKMIEAGQNPDYEARWAQLVEAEAILMEDMPIISVFQTGGASLINPAVTGIEDHSVGVPFIYKNVQVNAG